MPFVDIDTEGGIDRELLSGTTLYRAVAPHLHFEHISHLLIEYV